MDQGGAKLDPSLKIIVLINHHLSIIFLSDAERQVISCNGTPRAVPLGRIQVTAHVTLEATRDVLSDAIKDSTSDMLTP